MRQGWGCTVFYTCGTVIAQHSYCSCCSKVLPFFFRTWTCCPKNRQLVSYTTERIAPSFCLSFMSSNRKRVNKEIQPGAQHYELHIGCQSSLWLFYCFTAIKTEKNYTICAAQEEEFSLFALFLVISFTMCEVLNDFNYFVPTLMQDCWSSLTFC